MNLQLIRKILFHPSQIKIHIFAPSCNILYNTRRLVYNCWIIITSQCYITSHRLSVIKFEIKYVHCWHMAENYCAKTRQDAPRRIEVLGACVNGLISGGRTRALDPCTQSERALIWNVSPSVAVWVFILLWRIKTAKFLIIGYIISVYTQYNMWRKSI